MFPVGVIALPVTNNNNREKMVDKILLYVTAIIPWAHRKKGALSHIFN